MTSSPHEVLDRLEALPVDNAAPIAMMALQAGAWKLYGPRLVAVARAAQELTSVMDETTSVEYGPGWHALRAALAALGEEASHG